MKASSRIGHLASGFTDSCRRYPERVAISIGEVGYTYAALGRLADRVRETLLLHPGDPRSEPLVAVLGGKTLGTYVAILGGLGAGCGYVPLNPEFPVSRLKKMLARSRCRYLIATSETVPLLPALLEDAPGGVRVLVLDETGDEAAIDDCTSAYGHVMGTELAPVPEGQSVPADVAYLLFTSGSTGEPKGVAVTHHNVCSFLSAWQERYQIVPEDRLSHTFALTFDLSVFDMFMAWSAGACLCVPGQRDVIKPGRYIRDQEISVWFSVPATARFMQRLKELKPDRYPGLRFSLFCGEALPVEIARAWAASAPNSVVENLYGPTEATIACTAHRYEVESDAQSAGQLVPIGQPVGGMSAVIVNERLEPVPPGTRGELLLSGPQVTPGYWLDSERTGTSFIRLPDCSDVYYRTGDIVLRPTPDGPIEYLARRDNQVQVNGHRVELAEVELALRSFESVDDAVVVGWPSTGDAVHGLVAFLSGQELNVAAVSTFLRESLPPYMVPSRFEMLDEFPLNPNGKCDRNALRRMLDTPEAVE